MRQRSRGERFQQPLLEDPTLANNTIYLADGTAIAFPLVPSGIANRTRYLTLPIGAITGTGILTAAFGPIASVPNAGGNAYCAGFIPADYVAASTITLNWWYDPAATGQIDVTCYAGAMAPGGTTAWNIEAGTARSTTPGAAGQTTVLSYTLTDSDIIAGAWFFAALVRGADANTGAVDFGPVRMDYTADG